MKKLKKQLDASKQRHQKLQNQFKAKKKERKRKRQLLIREKRRQNLQRYYTLRMDRERLSRKFKVKSRSYTIQFDQISSQNNISLISQVIDSALRDVKEEMECQPNDHLRINISHPSLKTDIWIPFTKSRGLTAEVIMDRIQAVQQSNEDFKLEDGHTQITVIHVMYPNGSGGTQMKHLHIDKTKFKKDKQSIVRIKNDDHLCLPRAIVVARLHAEKPTDPNKLVEWKAAWERIRKSDRPFQKDAAVQLMTEAGCIEESGTLVDGCGPEEWEKLQDVLFPQYRLKIFQLDSKSKRLRVEPLYRGRGLGKCLNVLYGNHHYDAITSMPGLCETPYFCDYCNVGYRNHEDHRTVCPVRCNQCLSSPPCPSEGLEIQCQCCRGIFQNMKCYLQHLNPYSPKTTKSVCQLMGRCLKCNQYMTKSLLRRHLCQKGEKMCSICHKVVKGDHRCYVQTLPEKKKKKENTFMIFFDFECTQDQGEHIPNLCIAHRVCQHCKHLPLDDPCDHCDQLDDPAREKIFSGPNTLEHFMGWLFHTCQLSSTTRQKSMTHEGATVMAHNFKGYDGQFILNFLVHHACVKPSVIMNGTKILSMEVCNIKFLDSFNFLPSALSKLPSAFGLTELKKGYFPHYFNTEQNQHYVGPYPPAAYYNPDGMKPKDREVFFKWYETKTHDIFDFQKEIIEYCRSDVDILRRCCIEFQKTLKTLVQVDPFEECITFASTANKAYRRKFMPPETIAILPTEGYHPARKYSVKALRWLLWMEKETGRRICHARNGGEIEIYPYTVDGYQYETHTIYEFYGCHWHGCPECYPNMKQQPHPHRWLWTYGQLHQYTLDRERYFNDRGYRVISIWEHDFERQLKENKAMRDFMEKTDIQDPLCPREALYGGRTNATRLYCDEGDMRYIDVCSLYPFVLKYGTFPVGHPEIVTSDFKTIDHYFGLIQCRVLPPRGLYHPVLPYRTRGKLLFPLCRTCAEHPEDLESDDRCTHTDEERCLTGTWVTTELQVALDKGYVIQKIYEVWHFPTTRDDLFKKYINTFLKIKQEASGYPPECQTDEDKQRFIDEIYQREHILLFHVEKNPVLRTIAKYFLNCLWGKFAQRLKLPRSRYLSQQSELIEMMNDVTLDVKHVELLENEKDSELDLLLVNYTDQDEFVEPSPFGNVVIACFTTALARIHLYKTLDQIGDRVLYYDTDSIIYVHKDHLPHPPIMDSLGQWTDELDGDHIVKFVSGGPKNYAYQLASGKTVCKVKGLTLDYQTSEIVNLQTMEELVKRRKSLVTVQYPKRIFRDKHHKIWSKDMKKEFRLVYDKRQIVENFNTLPFGY